MKHSAIEKLEKRQLFQAVPLVKAPTLSAADVTAILGQAASQALASQAIVVEDRSGNVLGEFDGSALGTMSAEEKGEIRLDAALRAKTASYFESAGEAFTTRTARFIIQDHFPFPIKNTPGGPLYGVEFSSAAASDVIPVDTNPNSPYALASLVGPAGLSGDPGGIPLYIVGLNSDGKRQAIPVGSIGVAGDMSDVAARKDLYLGNVLNADGTHEFQYATAANPTGRFFNGKESADFDESVAEAGALGFMAPKSIRANNVFINGLRLPFLASPIAHKNTNQSLNALVDAGAGTVQIVPQDTTSTTGTPFTIAGVAGTLARRNLRANPTQVNQDYGFVDSNDTDPNTGAALTDSDKLTMSDVTQIITDAVKQAKETRAGIRNPIGSHAVVFVSVVDRDGDLLGSFGMSDATNFSYDVSVQKARTAAFFSDDTHAFSDRAIGFLSQRYLAPGINNSIEGPLFDVQDGLKFADIDSATGDIVDDTLQPLGTVASAAIIDASTGVLQITATAAIGQTFHAGQIVTFNGDTSREYLITADTAGSLTLQLDGIDNPPGPIPVPAVGVQILPKNPLKDGITIFPGGEPLYKNGQLVGAIGVSGDGVDQDDIISYMGTTGYRPNPAIESDSLGAASVASFIGDKLQTLENTFILGSAFTQGISFDNSVSEAEKRIEEGLAHEDLPYVKFPRNPDI